jgi:hypothetical protein
MRFLLDTDHISFLQRKSGIEHEILIRRIRKVISDNNYTRMIPPNPP